MNDPLYMAVVDGHLEVPIEKGQLQAFDFSEVEKWQFHILAGTRSVHARVESYDSASRTFVIKLAGDRFQVTLKDQHDLLVDRLGLTKSAASAVSDIHAPMPGLVLDVMVQAGQTVEAGQPLLILEAMKMENVIKAQGAATISSVEILKGTTVDKGQLLVCMT